MRENWGARQEGSKCAPLVAARNTLVAMLTGEDRAILDFERWWWAETGPKDVAIEFELGLTASEYYERLRVVVGTSEALSYDPLTVQRVRRMIESPSGWEQAV